MACLLHHVHGPHTRHTDASKQRTVAYLSSRGQQRQIYTSCCTILYHLLWVNVLSILWMLLYGDRWANSCNFTSKYSFSNYALLIISIRIRINEVALQRAEMRMAKWMCGIKLKDRFPRWEVGERLWRDDITLVLQQNRLRWHWHVLRKEDNDWVKKCMEYEVDSSIDHLHDALDRISSWMTANLLTLNSSKTEFLLIGLSKQLAKINNSSFTTTHSARNLGFIFDEHLTFSDQISCSCSLAVLDPRVGHTMDVLSPFIPVLCHSDWLFHGESCPRLDVVHPGCAWPSSPSCTWHCSLNYLFLQATPLFPHCVTTVC